MNTQQPYYYDKASYEKHQQMIEKLLKKEAQLLEELKDLDKHMTDDCIQPSAVARTEQKLGAVRTELQKLRNMDVRLANENAQPHKVTVGHAYHALASYADGSNREFKFKLVSAFPQINVNGQLDELTISSPIGKAIVGKELGEPCVFEANGKKHFILVLEELKQENSNENAEME